MHFGDIVAVQLQSHDGMTATLGQQHTFDLRIGSWPILVAAAAKGCRVGGGIRGVEQRAINGHKPIATKERAGHARWRRDHLTAFLQQRLHALAAQFLAPSRSEEHTSELQSRRDLVCRLLLEKKKKSAKHLHEQRKKKTTTQA